MSTSRVQPLMYQVQYARRLLLVQHNPVEQSPAVGGTAPTIAKNPIDPTEPYNGTNNGFDANVVMVLSVLLCALICSLGVNSIIKCALRCSNLMPASSNPPVGAEKGIKKKALKSFSVVNYSPKLKLPGVGTECVICLSEFGEGERLRLLPKCHHGFHIRCIDKWLKTHSSCPTCRHCLIETCHKIIIVGCGQASSSSSSSSSSSTSLQTPLPTQTTVLNIAPLEREDFVSNY